MYDHPGGIKIKGKEKKQWVYFVCDKCNQQITLDIMGFYNYDDCD